MAEGGTLAARRSPDGPEACLDIPDCPWSLFGRPWSPLELLWVSLTAPEASLGILAASIGVLMRTEAS